MPNQLEATFLFQLRAVKLPIPQSEYRFAPPRRWRFDFAWPEHRIAVECEGGIWVGGRHTRGKGFEEDCRKYNAAIIQGWRVLRFTSRMVGSGEALQVIEKALTDPKRDKT